jgi:carboxylesterase type B
MSVTTLLSMPLAEGLFAQAIARSDAAAHTLTAQEGRMVGGCLLALRHPRHPGRRHHRGRRRSRRRRARTLGRNPPTVHS